jgi:hypothetical protein
MTNRADRNDGDGDTTTTAPAAAAVVAAVVPSAATPPPLRDRTATPHGLPTSTPGRHRPDVAGFRWGGGGVSV